MSKIDITKWKDFKISEVFVTEKRGNIFQVPTGASISQAKLTDGDIPRISVSNYNNGIINYYGLVDNTNYRVYENFISVSFLGTVFYQQGKATLDMKVHCLKPLNESLNIYTGLFLSAVVKKSIQNISYADQISSTVLPNLIIKLPVDSFDNPDFKYMESYIENLMPKVKFSIDKLKEINKLQENKLNIDNWKTFHIFDIFDIDSGTKLDRVKMNTSIQEINFVGRSNFANGITQKVKKIDKLEPYPAGYLTLALGGAYLGSCFVQPEPFYTSQNVSVLIPKSNISFLAKQFIATAIFKESQNNYQAFIKELNAHIKKDFVIKLPADTNGNPDYTFMDQYMKNIDYKVKQNFTILNNVINN